MKTDEQVVDTDQQEDAAIEPQSEPTPAETWELRRLALLEELGAAIMEQLRLEEESKAAKESAKERGQELRRHIARGVEKYPLLDQAQQEADNAGGEAAWWYTSTEDLGIPDAVCQSLRENPDLTITMLRDLRDWCREHQLTDVPLVGPTKAEQIEDCMQAFWRENPECREAVEDEEETRE